MLRALQDLASSLLGLGLSWSDLSLLCSYSFLRGWEHTVCAAGLHIGVSVCLFVFEGVIVIRVPEESGLWNSVRLLKTKRTFEVGPNVFQIMSWA